MYKYVEIRSYVCWSDFPGFNEDYDKEKRDQSSDDWMWLAGVTTGPWLGCRCSSGGIITQEVLMV